MFILSFSLMLIFFNQLIQEKKNAVKFWLTHTHHTLVFFCIMWFFKVCRLYWPVHGARTTRTTKWECPMSNQNYVKRTQKKQQQSPKQKKERIELTSVIRELIIRIPVKCQKWAKNNNEWQQWQAQSNEYFTFEL